MLTNEDYLNIFHEIKNSITLISGSLQLVAKKHPEACEFDYWGDAMSEIDSLKDMVTQISSVRLCSQATFIPADIYEFMEQITNTSLSLSPDGSPCRVTIEENLPYIDMDSRLLKHALVNLIKNSYEAADTPLPVEIRIFLKNGFLHIVVADHSGGLDAAVAANIFQPFTTTKSYGSGLGLAITKQIIEAHHGTITCNSALGDGCTFTITIPATQN